jgi:hypothetical protein
MVPLTATLGFLFSVVSWRGKHPISEWLRPNRAEGLMAVVRADALVRRILFGPIRRWSRPRCAGAHPRRGDRAGPLDVRAGRLVDQSRVLIARAARTTTVTSEINVWIIIRTLARRDRMSVSVGLNAALALNATNR